MAVIVAKTEIWEDQGCTFLGRVRGADGANITASDVTSFTREVFDLGSTTPDTAVDATTATAPTTSDIHTVTDDSRWDEDPTGYNFENTIGSSVFAKPNRRYRIQYTFTPSSTSEYQYHAVGEVTTKSIRGG